MPTVKVTPRSLTDAYKRREGDFSPNLVGLQFTDGASLFTFGNFQITTNLNSKLNKNFELGGQWSDYYSLDNLNLNQQTSQILLSNDIFVRLNFDINNISRYVYFGSFYEYARVSIEQVISKWKGSLYLNPTSKSNMPVNTVLSFSYNSGIDTSSFLISKNIISNPFELVIDENNNFSKLLPDDIFNLSRDYKKYVVWNGVKEFNVIGYTGSTTNNPYLTITTKGNPFPSLTASTFGQLTYHIKPNKEEVELFFNYASDFEKIILNRLTTPIYTSSFTVPQEADGFITYINKSLTWPISDGYNLDINTRDYALYVENMLAMASLFDSYKTDLVARKFVSESIHEFDTNGDGTEIYGRKVNKLLRIYGREFDEVKKYIDGISFANVVTYNKLDNTSDELIKIIAKNLGFDVLLTVTTDNFNLQQQIQPSFDTHFSGYSRSLSAKELDVELWRRLVINAWWLYKSKGTRKVIEFFFKLFNISECMISLDEYIYLADNRLNPIKVWEELSKIYGDSDLLNLSDLPMDDYGFPRIPQETNDNYFQINGFWYNGGSDSTLGNNPHFGPYDFGVSYFDQFECFVPNFNDLLTGTTNVTVNTNYFNNYNEGTFIFDQNGLPVPYYGTGYADALNTNSMVENAIVNSAGLTYVGGNNAPSYGRPSGDTYSMKISFSTGTKETCDVCNYELSYGDDGVVYINTVPKTPLQDEKCCQNYWLPSTNASTVVCPTALECMISSDLNPLGPCVVISAGVTVPESCCNKTTLGFNVSWDGRKCFDASCIKDTSTGVTTPRGPVMTAQIIPANTLFMAQERQLPLSDSFVCYWCPPESYITKVCSADEYIALLTDQQILDLAISLGYVTTSLIRASPSIFLSNILSGFFNTYGCLLLDNVDKPINNNACCRLRGGEWILEPTSNTYYCVTPNINPCASTTVNPSHVYVTPAGNLLSKECCTANYTDGSVVTINSTTGANGNLVDSVGLSFANLTGNNNYCSACPPSISISNTDSYVLEYPSGADLTQQCCTDYGFTYNTLTGKCLKCPVVTNIVSGVIVKPNGVSLDETCCLAKNGWYGIGPASLDLQKCYQCAPVSSGGYTITSNEVLFNGTSISQACCTSYKAEVNNTAINWNTLTNKCVLTLEPLYSSFTVKVGTSPCIPIAPGVCGVYSSALLAIGLTTVYVPYGFTPATTTKVYTDSNLTTFLTSPFFEYGFTLYQNVGGTPISFCTIGSSPPAFPSCTPTWSIYE